MRKILLIIFFLVLVFSLFNSIQIQEVNAKGIGLVPCGRQVPCTLCHFPIMINRIVKFLLVPDSGLNGNVPLVPAVAALMFAIGGFMMVFAYAGEKGPEMISQAKKLFTAVIIGLVIIYGAWLIINAFFWAIGVRNPADWTKFCQ